MDTVAEENEDDEVDTEHHSVALDSALGPDSVKHHLVPVFAGQYLTTQFTRRLLSTSSFRRVYPLTPQAPSRYFAIFPRLFFPIFSPGASIP